MKTRNQGDNIKKVFVAVMVAFMFLSCASKESNIDYPVYTRVCANDEAAGSHGFVYVREVPVPKTKAVGKLYTCLHGYCEGVLIEQQGPWCKIALGRYVGYVETDKVEFQSWYDGTGEQVIVAALPFTPIYGESYDGEDVIDDYIGKGTVIADCFEDIGGDYFMLITAHDYLYVRKSDVMLVAKKDLYEYMSTTR
jgi:hypothetical protein